MGTREFLSSDSFSRLVMATWDGISDIRVVNPKQFLVTFDSSEAMTLSLSGGVLPVSSFCAKLKQSSMEVWKPSRLMWIEMFSIPPSAWSSNNMICIANQWGEVRGFDERTLRGLYFVSARLLIATEIMEYIDGHVNFALGDHLILVRVREVLTCPSSPSSLACSVEAAAMVEFPSSRGEDVDLWNAKS